MFIPIHDANPLRHISLHYVTLALIAANIVVFLLVEGGVILGSNEGATYAFAFIPRTLFESGLRPDAFTVVPDPGTLVTYTFLHADFWHLAGNMLFLWVFGDNVEDAVGHWKFLAFYLLCAIGAALAHFAFASHSSAALIGASGAVAGVVAAYLLLHPRVKIWVLVLFRIPLRLSAIWLLGAWILFQIYNLVVSTQGGGNEIGWWAHIGGLVTGGLLILVLRRPGVPLLDRNLGQEPA